MFSITKAVYYDGDNDGWITIPTTSECNSMFQAGVPVECTEGTICLLCGDANGNRVWCTPDCKVTTGNYAVYLTTLGQSGEHNHDDRYYTKTETDNIVTGLNNRITQLENYVNMIICQLLPKGLVKGMTCPVY